MAKNTNTTIDHDEIQQWIEDREGVPAMVRTDGLVEGMLRVDFGDSEENLMEVSWGDFFRMFEEQNLSFVYEEVSDDGEVSIYHEFSLRDGEEDGVVEGFGDDEDEDDEDEDDLAGFGEEESY